MIYHLLLCFIGLVLDLFDVIQTAPDEKDLQIVLLRQQLRILERKTRTKPRLSSSEKLMMVALFTRFKQQTQDWYERLQQTALLFKPDTLLKWHRDLVRRKWTFKHRHRGGRPRLEAEIEALILRLALENPRMGYLKLHGELLKLGYRLDPGTVKNVLRSASVETGAPTGTNFMAYISQPLSPAVAGL